MSEAAQAAPAPEPADATGLVPAPSARAPYPSPRHPGWCEAVGEAIVARVGQGANLHAIAQEPGMPAHSTLKEWMRTRPEFGEAVRAARQAWGRTALGGDPGYCRVAAEAIFQRLCEGESLVSICRDDTLPARSCIYRWIRDIPDFREMVEVGRLIQGDYLAELGWDLAMGATPKTAFMTDVQLKHLRWYAGRIAPRKYGALKPVEPEVPAVAAAEREITVRFIDVEPGSELAL